MIDCQKKKKSSKLIIDQFYSLSLIAIIYLSPSEFISHGAKQNLKRKENEKEKEKETEKEKEKDRQINIQIDK